MFQMFKNVQTVTNMTYLVNDIIHLRINDAYSL